MAMAIFVYRVAPKAICVGVRSEQRRSVDGYPAQAPPGAGQWPARDAPLLVERKTIPKLKARIDGQTNPLIAIEQATTSSAKGYESMLRLPDFSVVVWLRKTDEFAALKAELLGAAATEPYESTEYQGMVDFHWSAPSLLEAQRLVDSLKGVARHPDLVLLRIMSQVDGVDSVSIKDERRTRH
jgi:hypothetical protein